MRVNGFNGCCGIRIIDGFGHTSTASYNSNLGIKEIEEYIEKNKKSKDQAIVLIALNQEQIERYGKMIDRLQFKPLMKDVYHPGHGNNITLYGYALNEENCPKPIRPEKTKDSVFQACMTH